MVPHSEAVAPGPQLGCVLAYVSQCPHASYNGLLLRWQWPDMMPKLRTDLGAIKFVLSGANIMCPGLTSPGATIHEEVDADAPAGEHQFDMAS